MNRPKIKICGMKYPGNIEQMVKLQPDYMGFIFYEKSKRFVNLELDALQLKKIRNIQKVGVFVNESIHIILKTVEEYGLDLVQLHGDETADFCKELSGSGIPVIKAFGMDEGFDFKKLEAYKPYCTWFLFDTKTSEYGGSGKIFNWGILKEYDNDLPFFLSGGIGLEDISKLKAMLPENLNIAAIDLNSRLEVSPGLKDIDKVKKIMELVDKEFKITI